jgi:uncharacterized membrane protein
MMVSIILLGGGAVVVLLTFWLERSIIKTAVDTAVDAAFETGAVDQARADELARKYERERNVVEWLRVIGAIAVLIGILLNLW